MSIPDATQSDRLLGTARHHLNSGRVQEAEHLCRDILARQPMHAEANILKGQLLLQAAQYQQAIGALGKALKTQPDNPGGHFYLGLALYMQGNTREAIPCYERVLQLAPDNINALQNLAIAQLETGLLQEAAGNFRRTIELRPQSAKAHYHLARMRTHASTAEEIELMKTAYGQPDTGIGDRIYLAFGLGNALDKQGRHDEAFDYYTAGHRLGKERSPPFSIEQQRQLFARLKATFSDEYLKRNSAAGADSTLPVFIVGMPRSGTTLTEQILSSHPQVHGAGELPYVHQIIGLAAGRTGKPGLAGWEKLGKRDIQSLGRKYLELLRTHSGKARHITDTTPLNFLYIGLIATILPGARFVHCCRDPLDTCASIYQQMLSDAHNYGHDLTELGQFYRLYEDLMRHWHSVLPGRIHDFRYENVISDSETSIRKLLDFCGLPFNTACLAFHRTQRAVRTPSDSQVRQPIYSSSIGRWKRYGSRLQPLLDILG